MSDSAQNLDPATVAGFGDEWTAFDQQRLDDAERREVFERYFRIFPWPQVGSAAIGFDAGCGSGRWAQLVAPRVGELHCVDASQDALEVARRALVGHDNVAFHHASVGALPFEDATMDFGYSLGVLHHVPDTGAAIAECARPLRPGAPLLLYLYYALDGRPAWYRLLWQISDRLRRGVCKAPHRTKLAVSAAMAVAVYWPLARTAALLERLGRRPDWVPLAFYRHRSLYTMRTDAYDRFGTQLEQRFTADQVRELMVGAGLERITLSDAEPFWCAVGYRR